MSVGASDVLKGREKQKGDCGVALSRRGELFPVHLGLRRRTEIQFGSLAIFTHTPICLVELCLLWFGHVSEKGRAGR